MKKGIHPVQKVCKVKCACGNEFEVSTLNTKTKRCTNCTKLHRNNYQKEYMRNKI